MEFIYIHPTKKLVTDEEIEALRQRQCAVALSMGAKWLLHPDNAIEKKQA